jgi:hypothetical protein
MPMLSAAKDQPRSSESTDCDVELACASIAVPACTMIW